MTESQKIILKDVYQNYLAKRNQANYKLHELPQNDLNQLTTDLSYLEEKELISYISRAIGYVDIKLTAKGIDFIENNYQESSMAPIVQGHNSIYIQGSGNTVSDNYNNISIDISDSDLPEEFKELIESFLYEIKNPKLTPERKTDKIRQFLLDLTSGTLSGAAASGLTVLLSSLFKQIPF